MNRVFLLMLNPSIGHKYSYIVDESVDDEVWPVYSTVNGVMYRELLRRFP